MSAQRPQPESRAGGDAHADERTHGAFISYSHVDREFAARLVAALREGGRRAWMDELDIAPASTWAADLQRAIEAADAFVFVISPDSLASAECGHELEHAGTLNKRIVPLALRETDVATLPAALATRQLIPSRGLFEDDFERSLELLVGAIETDLDWVREHTDWGQKALEWTRHEGDRSFLLSGAGLDAAEQWLARGSGMRPEPTDLQRRYVLASRQSTTTRLRRTRAFVSAALVVAIGLAVLAFVEQRSAVANEHTAQSRQRASDAIVQLASDPAGSTATALAALRIKDTPQAEAALRDALPQLTLRRVFDAGTPLSAAVFSPDARRVVTTSDADGAARIWDVASGRVLATMVEPGRAALTGAGFSSDGSRVVTASADGTARVWQVPSGRALETIVAPGGSPLSSAVFSPDGRRILTAEADGTARIWNAAGGALLITLGKPNADQLNDASFSPDGTLVVTAGIDGSARVWDAQRGTLVVRLTGAGGGPLLSASFDSSGRRVVGASSDGHAPIWVTGDPSHPGEITAPDQPPFRWAAFGPTSGVVVTAGDDGTAGVWDLLSQGELTVLRGHAGIVRTAEFSPDGRTVLTAGVDGTARLWSASPPELLARLRQPGVAVRVLFVAYSPDGRRLVTVGSDYTVRVRDLATGRPVRTLAQAKGSFPAALQPSVSPDGTRVVVPDADGSAHVWSLATGRQVLVLRGGRAPVASAVFSPDGRHILTASSDGTATVWDASSGRRLLALAEPGRRSLNAAAYGADGRLIVTASADGSARVWRARDGRQLVVVRVPGRATLYDAAFSRDGRRFVTASSDGRARVWATVTGRQAGRTIVEPDHSTITTASFSPNGRDVLTTATDGSASIWDARTGVRLTTFTEGVGSEIADAAWAPDGRRVATAAATAAIWSTELAGPIDALEALARRRIARAS